MSYVAYSPHSQSLRLALKTLLHLLLSSPPDGLKLSSVPAMSPCHLLQHECTYLMLIMATLQNLAPTSGQTRCWKHAIGMRPGKGKRPRRNRRDAFCRFCNSSANVHAPHHAAQIIEATENVKSGDGRSLELSPAQGNMSTSTEQQYPR